MTNPAHRAEERRLDAAMRLFGELEQLKTDEPLVASPIERLASRATDLGILIAFGFSVICAFAVAGLFVLDWDGDTRFQDEAISAGEFAFLISAPIAIFVAWAVHESWFAARRGQTFGKRMMGLHVVDNESGEPVTAMRMLARWLCWAIPSGACFIASIYLRGWPGIVLFLGAGAALVIPLWFFVDPGSRGLHDRWFGTKLLVPRHGPPK